MVLSITYFFSTEFFTSDHSSIDPASGKTVTTLKFAPFSFPICLAANKFAAAEVPIFYTSIFVKRAISYRVSSYE